MLTFIVGICCVNCQALAADQWQPPLGIPTPPFGVTESISDREHTYWVDNTRIECVQDGNGTPERPRCTLPRTLDAGSIVQVRGGPYSGNQVEIRGHGTPNAPVWVRGPSNGEKIRIDAESLLLVGNFLIIENISVSQISIKPSPDSQSIVIRHSEISRNPGTGALLKIGQGTRQLVIWRNEISYNGVIPSRKDNHGIAMRGDVEDVWIIDNHIHHNSGDSIQFCNSCVGKGNGPGSVYIGRNVMHHDEENAIDLKEFKGPVIISENRMYGYRALGFSGHGEAIRINDEGNQGDVWLINNTIFDSEFGVNTSSSRAKSYLVGNLIFDISQHGITKDSDLVVGNSLINIDGDAVQNGRLIANNLFYNVRGNPVGSKFGTCTHNLSFKARLHRNCDNSVHADPFIVFADDGSPESLRVGSPAVDQGISYVESYEQFRSSIAMHLNRSINGISRPQGTAWDIGAFEIELDRPSIDIEAPEKPQ